MEMGHSAAVWDYKAATGISKDWNGVDQVVLRNPQGASARVRHTSLFLAHLWIDIGAMFSSWIVIIIICLEINVFFF